MMRITQLERELLGGREQWHYFYVRSNYENVVEREHLASYTDEREGARIFYLWTMHRCYRQKNSENSRVLVWHKI